MPIEIKKISQDPALAQSGVWVVYDADNGVRLLIAPLNGPRFSRSYQAALRPYSGPGKRRKLDDNPELTDKIRVRALASSVLIGWEGFLADGKEYPYSVDNAEALLNAAPDLRAFVEVESQKLENFQSAALEEEAANLKSGTGVVA